MPIRLSSQPCFIFGTSGHLGDVYPKISKTLLKTRQIPCYLQGCLPKKATIWVFINFVDQLLGVGAG